MLWDGDVLGYGLMEKREEDGTFVLIVAVLRLLQWIFAYYLGVRAFVC